MKTTIKKKLKAIAARILGRFVVEFDDDASEYYRIKVKPGTRAMLPSGRRINIDEAYISTITETGSYLPQADGTYMRFTDPDLYIPPDAVG